MINASHCKIHPHVAGAKGGNQDMSRTQRGLNTKLHMAADSHGMLVRAILTEGTRADCKQALPLIVRIEAKYLLADKAYDTDNIITHATSKNMEVVIPSKRNRKVIREHDKSLYKLRNLVENVFLHLKQWRGIATRYAKSTASFLAAVHIRCLSLWMTIS